MAKIYGGRSKYLVKNDWKFFTIAGAVIPALILVFVFCVIALMFSVLDLKINPYISLTLMLFLVLMLKRFKNTTGKDMLKTQKLAYRISDRYNRGWRGEEVILDVLKTLSDNYTIFCDVNLYNKGNIDFIVLGPRGLLAVEVKSHSGNITFENGRLLRNGYPFKEKDFMVQVKNEALGLNRYLKEKIQKDIFVKPIIVFSNKHANVKFGLNPINNVFVVQKEYLIKLIESLPEAMGREEADEIEQSIIDKIKN